MAYIAWKDEFSVNVKEIDDQHRMLVDMINSLHEALMANRARDVQRLTVDKMIDYAANHFDTEEKYMKQFKFFSYREHKAEHDLFTAKALELQGRMNMTGFVLTLEILNFLKDWLQHHILKIDKGYTRHFNENGLC
jgi:hemerythrin